MAIYSNTVEYENYLGVLIDHESLSAPTSVTVDPSKLSADADGQKRVEPGDFLAVVSGVGRKLPRTRLDGSTATNSTIVPVADHTAFVSGDVVAAPAVGTIVLAATWASGDTLAVTLGDRAQTYTATAAVLADIAAGAATALNAGSVGTLATVVASGDVLYVQVDDLVSRTFSVVATTTGNGTATASAIANQALGTVAAAANGQLTLGADATTALPAGIAIGVLGAEVKGLNIAPTDLLTTKDIDAIGAYTSGHIRRARIPYLDKEIEAKFPNLQFL